MMKEGRQNELTAPVSLNSLFALCTAHIDVSIPDLLQIVSTGHSKTLHQVNLTHLPQKLETAA